MYDASRRSKRHAWMGRAAQLSGIACLVGVQRAVQNNGNVKSEPKYLGLMKDLQYVLSTVELFLALFLLSWLLRWTDLLVLFFVRVASRRLRLALTSALDSAKYVRCEGPVTLSSPSSVVKINVARHHVMHVVSDILPGCDLNLTFLSATAN